MEPAIPSVLRVSSYTWTGSYESRWAVLGQEKTMNRVATRVGRETTAKASHLTASNAVRAVRAQPHSPPDKSNKTLGQVRDNFDSSAPSIRVFQWRACY